MSLEGSVLYKNEGFTALKNGKPDPDAFRGMLDESLDTLKLKEVYKKHEDEIGYPYLDGKKLFCRAVVNLSFNRAVKLYESYGNRYVLNGYSVTDEDMEDHVCIRSVNGKPTLIAIEVSYKEKDGYAPVEEPISDMMIGKYFEYDAETRSYKRSDKTIPYDVTCQEIREYLYTYGFDIDGVHYVRYKRSAGASRDGRCLFIAEPLYADMMAWSSCDLSGDTASDQASWQAYIALTLSSIENTIELPKKAILVIRDRVSRFTADAVCVKETETHDLMAEEEETEVENVIWDGEALLDAGVFLENGYNERGMMLLRNRFFKTCAFNTNLQDWFFDNDITEISQLAGYTTARKIEDIKLVVTESSIKYFKFMPKDMPFAEKCKRWLDAMYEGKNNSTFGVVKADHDAPLMDGRMAYTNYQLLNTLGLTREGIGKLLEPSFDYLQAMLNKSPFLRYQINMTTDHATIAEKELPDLAKYRRDTVLDMSCRTPLFEQTEFYKSFRSDTTKYFKERLKKGRVAVCGNYEVLFGNAYEFLVALTDEDYEPTESFSLEDGQVCTTGFAHGDTVLCARSPHITMGNLYLAENVHCYDLLRYFNLTPNIICVNAIESNIQQRLNGCDYDSDSMLVTNDPWIIAGVTSCYNILKVPVCKAEPIGKTDYENTPKSLAKLDQTIAKNKIGEIVNLSQFLNCLLWDSLFREDGACDYVPMQVYYDICILAVMSGMEIDKAKRLYSADSAKVLARLRHYRKNFKAKHGGNLPAFYKFIVGDESADVGENTVSLEAPMAFVHDAVASHTGRAAYTKTIPLSELFDLDVTDAGANDTHKKQNIIAAVKEAHTKITAMQTAMKEADDDEKLILCDEANEVYQTCLKIVSKNVVNDHILCMLLSEIDQPDKSKYDIKSARYLLFASLLYEDNRRLLSRLKVTEGFVPYDLVRIEPEDVPSGSQPDMIYGFPHGRLIIQ
jgi:hypothetical protein